MTTLAEVLQPRGYRTGGFVGAFVLDGRWGIAPGIRRLLRRVRSVEVSKSPAASMSCSGPAAKWSIRRWPGSRRTRPSRSSRGCTSTIRTRPMRRRSRTASRFPATARAHTTPRSRPRTHRSAACWHLRASGRLDPPSSSWSAITARCWASTAKAARVLHLRRRDPDSVDHRRPRRAGARRPRTGAHRGRDADDAGPGCASRSRSRAGHEPAAAGAAANALGPAGVQRDLVSALSLRVERADGACATAAIKFIAAPRRELYDTQTDPRRDAQPRGVEPAHAPTRSNARFRDFVARTSAPARRPRQPRAVDPGRRGTTARARLRGAAASARAAHRGAAARRPEGQDRALQPAEAGGARFGRGRTRRRHRQGAPGARRRSRDRRGLHDARQHAHQGEARRRGDRRLSAGARRSIPENRAPRSAWRSPTGRPAKTTKRRAGFERVLRLNPRDCEAAYQLADIWMQRGQFAEPRRRSRRAVADGRRARRRFS